MRKIWEVKRKVVLSAALFFAVCSLFSAAYGLRTPEQQQALEMENSIKQALKSHTVSMRGENLSVAILLRTLAKKAGVNIIVADNIDDTISIDMENTNLYDLFHVAIESKKLNYAVKNSIIYVAKKSEVDSNVLPSVIVEACPRYGSVSEYLPHLTPLMNENGVLTVSERTNCFIIQDTEEVAAQIKEMLTRLDQPVPQVHIRASIVSVSKEAKKQLGIKWGYTNYRNDDFFESRDRPINASSDTLVEETGNIVFGILANNLDLDIELQALQEDDLLKILSAPQILVLNNKEAEIKQGQEVPFVAQSGDSLNTSFREANLSLKVTPRVRENFVSLDINVNNDSVDTTTSGGEPLINKQEISTNLMLETGVTVVIGGIISNSEDSQKGGVPFLKDVPLLGNLFKNSSENNTRTELLVFITPTIISLENSDALTPKDKSVLDEYSDMKLMPGADISLPE